MRAKTDPDMSEALEAAVRWRGFGIGLVPHVVLVLLTAPEWGRVREMRVDEAQKIIKELDHKVPVRARITTAISVAELERLLQSEHT